MENFQNKLKAYTGAYVCQLSNSELEKRKKDIQKDVFSQVTKVEELQDGYTFHFEDKNDIDEKLAFYLLAEKRCCTFFQLDLSIKPNHNGIAFRISGAPEAKTFLKSILGDVLGEG